MSKAFLIRRGGQTIGPMTGKALRQLAAEGKVAPSDFVKREDTEWFRASEVDDLFLHPTTLAPTTAVASPSAATPSAFRTPGEPAAQHSDPKGATANSPFLESTGRLLGILALCSLGALALSSFMPWARVLGGGVSGIQGDGKIVLALSIAAIIAGIVAFVRTCWFAPIAALCMAWGTVAAVWMGILLYKTSTVATPNELRGNPFAVMFSAQLGPGLGLYVGLIAGICTAVFAGLLCIRSASPPNTVGRGSRFRWLIIGQSVAIPLAFMLAFLRFSVPSLPAPRVPNEWDKREQQLLEDSGKTLADIRERVAQNEHHTKRIRAVTAKEEQVQQLTKSGTDLLDAWQQVGLLVIDFETRKVVVDSEWWSGWSREKDGRKTVVNLLGMHFKSKTGKYFLTVYEDDGGKSVGMVHADGEVVIFR